MRVRSDPPSILLIAATALGLGALLMYVFDPQQGRRRRASARDQLVHAGREIAGSVSGTASDLGNRAQGMAAEARGALRETAAEREGFR